MDIRRARFPDNEDEVLSIFREYIGSASVNLDFQGNEAEFKTIGQKYSGKDSAIFLAWNKNHVIGCASFRKVSSSVCEMKRVYVRPTARKTGVGRWLVESVIKSAQDNGYKKICLDVLPEFRVAIKLYESIGFKTVEPIANNPVPGTKFLGLVL